MIYNSDIVSDYHLEAIFLAYTLTFFLAVYLASILTYLLAYILTFLLAFYLNFFSHSFWHSIWYIFSSSLWLRSGGENSDLGLAVEVRREHFDPELAVEVQRGTLWSRRCCSGPVGSGGEHCDLELAVEVRRGSPWSRGCCSGPAENTARSGGEHSDPELAGVWQGTLRSKACSWGPAGTLWSWFAVRVRRGTLRSSRRRRRTQRRRRRRRRRRWPSPSPDRWVILTDKTQGFGGVCITFTREIGPTFRDAVAPWWRNEPARAAWIVRWNSCGGRLASFFNVCFCLFMSVWWFQPLQINMEKNPSNLDPRPGMDLLKCFDTAN